MLDTALQVGMLIFFLVVFIGPIIHISIKDKEGKVRPFDFKDKS